MATKPLITEAILHQWGEQGSATVREELRTAIKSLPPTASALNVASPSSLFRWLYELVWVVLQTKLSRQDVLSLLNEAQLHKSPVACHVLIDLIWVIGNEVEAKEKGRERYTSSEWQALVRFVKDLAEEEIVPVLELKSSLECDLLHHAGLLSEPVSMNKKLVRVNTKTNYTQVKFNLLREESEGFAKVLALLHTGVSTSQLASTKTDLMALIGFFDLDANRVLDLVLDAYEMQPSNDCFGEVLALFKRDSIPHVLGFKFQFYKRDPTDGLQTPKSLYRVAATLIDTGLLDVNALLPHLSPSKEETVRLAHETQKELEKAAKAFGKVNLAAKADDDGTNGSAAEAASSTSKNADNQVLGLIMGFLEVGAHDRAFEMIQWFKERGVDALTHEPLMQQMCIYVHSLLDALYSPLSMKSMELAPVPASEKKPSVQSASQLSPTSSVETWLSKLQPILRILSGNLHNDAFLFTKILRIIAHYSDLADGKNEMTSWLKKLMIESFLPALSMQSCNPSAAFQMWDLLKNLVFDERYRLYQDWEALYASSPAMQMIEAQCVQNTRKIMRRLTADRAKPSARSLTHIAHSNPLVVFRTMLRQIQSYDNLILPVVECLKFVTPFGMDVLSYVLVSELAKSRKSMKADGTNISQWLTSLANFSGSFYRKYPNVELGGLLQYLIQRLRNWESVDLVVLSELLSKMGSCITFEDISASQLEAHAGGPNLWQEPSDPKTTNRRAIPRLRDALIKSNLALPLCLLICQVRCKIEFDDEASTAHLKSLGRMFDTSQMTLNQLLQFLNGVVEPSVYAAMLPSVRELVECYHIAPELVMTLCRPAIRSQDDIFKKAPRSVHSTPQLVTPEVDPSAKSWDMQSTQLLEDIAAAISSVSPAQDPFSGMAKEFYTTFWSMVLYDIHVPFPQYEAEIGRLRASIASQSNNNAVANSERKKAKEKTTQMIDKLLNEQKDQVAHRKRVYERLEATKAKFFKREDKESQTAVTELLQKCIVPRALLSPEDALFCAKFMERLHHMNTPEFVTVQYYSKVTLQLPSIVLCVTEREAANFGVFLKETMALLYRWNQSSVTYDEEAIHGKSGFSVDLNNPALVLTHRQYKSMYAKCHRSMVNLYIKALGSGEYMPIRNSLIVLTKLIDVFPSGKLAAECLLEIVDELTKEDREDIKIMARRYFALLTKRKATLVEDKWLSNGLTPPKKKQVETVEAKATTEDKTDVTSTPIKDGDELERDRGQRGRRGPSPSQDESLETGEVTTEKSERDRGQSSSSGGPARLKRRDSDRTTSGTDDSKRGRDTPSGTPAKISGNDRAGKLAAETSEKRRSRSRSMDRRRGQRDRDRGNSSQRDGKDSGPPPAPASSAKREADASSSSGSRAPPAEESEARKRQRIEETEASLRRQLSEKKEQAKQSTTSASTDASSQAKPAAKREGERNGSTAKDEPVVDASTKKMVSLVSRKRDRDPPAEADPATPRADADDGQDAKRRREAGRDENGGRSMPRGDTQQNQNQNQNRRDDRRKQQPQQNQQQQQQQNRSSSGSNSNSQTAGKADASGNGSNSGQQRDQSRNNRPDQQRNGGSHRGGGGNNGGSNSGNGDRRRDGGDGRRGGGGGGRR